MEGGLLKGTSEEGTDRGMDSARERGREEACGGGIERGREGAREGGKLQGRYPGEGTSQVPNREPIYTYINTYQERRGPFRKSPNKKAKCTEEIENRIVEEEGRERSLVYKKGTSCEWEAEARRGRGRWAKLNRHEGSVLIHPSAVNKDHLTCFYCNADHILSKRTEIETTLLIQKPL